MSRPIEWNLCIICQRVSSEELRCPNKFASDRSPAAIYNAFLENVEEFKNLNALPVKVDYGKQGTSETFVQNNALWHKHCHQKFNNSMLERVKLRLKRKRGSQVGEGEAACRPKRQSTTINTLCTFCGDMTTDLLHEFTTFNMDKTIRDMANEMCDSELLVKLSGGDLVAIEGKYHLSCLTSYRNRYRAFLRALSASSQSSISTKQAKARAFAELVMHVEGALEQGTYVFKLAELHAAYENRLKKLSVDFSTNRTRVKGELIDYFQKYGIQEQSDGKNVLLIFPEGMHSLLRSVSQIDSETLQLAAVAKIIRREIFQAENSFKFGAKFPVNCQKDCLPYNLNLLISMILYGPNLRDEENYNNSQSCLTISQLIIFNSKKRQTSSEKSFTRHSALREPPLPLYIGLNVHSLVRSKKLVEELHHLGISVSYDRVMQIEKDIAHSLCGQYQANKLVCPSHLRKGLLTVGAVDNIDHDPSSTTAQSSFHGTGISITQLPTVDDMGTAIEPVATVATKGLGLPHSYTVVPAVALNQSKVEVVQRTYAENFSGNLEGAILKEKLWLKDAVEILNYSFEDYKPLTWASYHAHLQPPMTDLPSITAMLPLFIEKADSPAMIKHAMDILKRVTSFLNPGQIPVMACDCPIFAKAKYIQWAWPATYGEDKFVIMFGGLHLEMGMWNMMGKYLACSGWTTALTNAGVATSGTADSFLKSSHLTRTRHAHQITCVALHKLQYQAFELLGDGRSFEQWRKDMIKKSPTIQYWDTILSIEILILVFVRAHRENNFSLFVEVLEIIVGFFFAFDHYNYARWVSVHIRDMSSLPSSIEDLKSKWVVPKTQHRFSRLPFDHNHEQLNAELKGKGGIIGLTESPVALQRWLLCGPEVARCISEFESELERERSSSPSAREFLHHEEGLTAQKNFKQQVNCLVDVIDDFGNPFKDDCSELLVLNTRACADDSVVETVRCVEALGKAQYEQYKTEVLTNKTASIHDAIKRNSLPLFSSPRLKLKSKSSQKLTAYRSNTSLFGRLYIANQQRNGDPAKKFHMKTNQPLLRYLILARLG